MKNVQIKNLKTLNVGPEGSAFSATIYGDGKRLGVVSYDGWGGGYTYDYSLSGGGRHRPSKATEALIDYAVQWSKDNDPDFDASPEFARSSALDMLMASLIDDFEEKRSLRRLTKKGKQTVYRLPDDQEGTWRIKSVAFSASVAKQLRAQHADVRIANEEIAS